jgi:hypothetical protein
MTRYLVCLVLALALIAPAANADGISISQSIDQHQIPYEDQVHFRIALSWDGPQTAYLFGKPLDPQFDRLMVQQYSSSIRSTGSGADEVTTKTYEYTLKPTQSGTGRIDPVTIEYVSWPDSIPGQLITEAMSVEIALPVHVETGGGGYMWLIVIGAIVVIVVVAAVAWRVRRSKRVEPAEPVRTPGQEFLVRLAELKADAGNDLKKFQTGLYKHLVSFLHERYRIDGATASADEIAEKLAATDMTKDHQEKISGWLHRAEREKFSPVAASPGETIRLETEIREFFEKNMISDR